MLILAIWSDIDFMIDKQTFSINEAKFPLSGIDTIHSKSNNFYKFYLIVNFLLIYSDIKYIPIVDVAVGTKHEDDEAL